MLLILFSPSGTRMVKCFMCSIWLKLKTYHVRINPLESLIYTPANPQLDNSFEWHYRIWIEVSPAVSPDMVLPIETLIMKKDSMSAKDLTLYIIVDQSPAEVFDAILNVRGWWSEEI